MEPTCSSEVELCAAVETASRGRPATTCYHEPGETRATQFIRFMLLMLVTLWDPGSLVFCRKSQTVTCSCINCLSLFQFSGHHHPRQRQQPRRRQHQEQPQQQQQSAQQPADGRLLRPSSSPVGSLGRRGRSLERRDRRASRRHPGPRVRRVGDGAGGPVWGCRSHRY